MARADNRIQPRYGDFSRGLETTRDIRSSDPMAFREFLNARVDRGHAKRRKGMVRLHRFAAPSVLMDFDGTDDDADLTTDARVTPLGTKFTLEMLFQTDDISSDRAVLGGVGSTDAITVTHTTTETLVVTVRDSAGTVTTLTHTGVAAGTLCALQIVRYGASIIARLNGTAQSGTMSATLTLLNAGLTAGSDNNGSFFDGRIDFVRLFRVAKASQVDGWCRLVDPRAPQVVFDYVFEPDANSYILDRGPLGLHVAANGTPATNVAPLAVNPMPVFAIAQNIDKDVSRQGYIRVKDSVYPVEFT